jgi:serine/threonine-protein kinase
VHERLGSGGQSLVFRAEHVESGSEVALKILSASGLDDSDARARLRREQRALTTLRHPNIVRVVGEGEETAGHYLAMELLAGETLNALVRARGPLPSSEVVSVGLAIASALDAVHRAGIVHRDVKPSNVVVVRGAGSLGPRARLIDFGTVLALDTLVRDDALVGTLPFMAPEVLAGQAPSATSDVYALGCTLHYLATGVLPVRGRSRAEVLASIANVASDASPIEPPELAQVVRRAMDHDRDARIATAAELFALLAATGLAEAVEPWAPPPDDVATRDVTLADDEVATSRRDVR